MSADNGIYILKTTDGYRKENHTWVNTFGDGITAYRVAHAQAIENFDYYRDHETHNLGWWMDIVWGKSEVYYDESEAFKAGAALLNEYSFVEYGMVLIDASDFNFPGC